MAVFISSSKVCISKLIISAWGKVYSLSCRSNYVFSFYHALYAYAVVWPRAVDFLLWQAPSFSFKSIPHAWLGHFFLYCVPLKLSFLVAFLFVSQFLLLNPHRQMRSTDAKFSLSIVFEAYKGFIYYVYRLFL